MREDEALACKIISRVLRERSRGNKQAHGIGGARTHGRAEFGENRRRFSRARWSSEQPHKLSLS
jgi:hypothetical protein